MMWGGPVRQPYIFVQPLIGLKICFCDRNHYYEFANLGPGRNAAAAQHHKNISTQLQPEGIVFSLPRAPDSS